MKTPEQMAEEYCEDHDECEFARDAFLAGYQAAKDQLQPQPFHKGADVYIIDANNPLPKPMPLSLAEQDQLADAGKVMKFNKGNNAEREKVNMKFAYDSFPVTEAQVQDIKQIRETFSSLTDLLTEIVPNGRYLSIVNTKLEEACMFAIKGITHQAGDYDKLQSKA